MRARGLTVGWPPFSPPHLGQNRLPLLLAGNDSADVAGSASPVEWPALSAEIPMLGSDWLELPANVARFPPDTVPKFAPRVDALVFNGADELEVFQSVVEFVVVDVVDLIAIGDQSVGPFPDNDVFHSESSLSGVPDASVSLFANSSVPAWGGAGWSSFAHADSLSHRHGSSPALRSDLLALAQ